MTLAAIWVRKNDTLRELVVASDSRISGGESWDACPKIVALPRPATVVVMSGMAAEAYVFLIQAINTCSLNNGVASGRMDLGYLARKLRSVYADIRLHVRDLPVGQFRPDVPDVEVALVGWSWRSLRFEGYSYRFDRRGTLQMRRLRELDGQAHFGVCFLGDATGEARRRLRSLGLQRPLRDDRPVGETDAGFFLDWQPLDVIRACISDPKVRSVGGAPQVFRMYQYGETESFVWRDSDGVDYFGGRPVSAGERFDRRVISVEDGAVVIRFSDQSIYCAEGSVK